MTAPSWWNDKGTGRPDWQPSLWRYLWHRLTGCSGAIVSDYDEQGNLWMGFQCWTCGKVMGAHRPPSFLTNRPLRRRKDDPRTQT